MYDCDRGFHFKMAFIINFSLILGGCGSSESSIRYLLNDKSSAKGVVLLPGGASESIWARAGPTYTIITSRRKGFIRIALSTGYDYVNLLSSHHLLLFLSFEILGKFIK